MYPIKIYNSDEQAIFNKDNIYISFDKKNKQCKKLECAVPEPGARTYDVCSVLGMLNAVKLSYIICVKEKEFAGNFIKNKIFKIKLLTYIPSEGQIIPEEDKPYINMLNDFVQRNTLYYCDTYDLTVSFKHLSSNINNRNGSYIFKHTVSHFCWNYSMANIFDCKGMEDFVYPVINGFFNEQTSVEYKEDSSFLIISRKDTRRSGMRFWSRGADRNGNTSNFLETEEIFVEKEDNNIEIYSFVQCRGSIPLIWTQHPNLQLNPPIIPRNDSPLNEDAFKYHVEELIKEYGSICLVNLIDKKKDQKIIGELYSDLVTKYKTNNKENSKNVDFVWFDFHAECKKMKYENIKKLLKTKTVKNSLENFNYTSLKIPESLLISPQNCIFDLEKLEDYFVNRQNGTFRTNCIDSLDRTNVIQSTFGRYFLTKILYDKKLSLLQPSLDDPFKCLKDSFEATFKGMWADHGDVISKAYSGTKALKGDFVRTGKRTIVGALQDGLNSTKRLFINNFRDGYNQDCHDYFLKIIDPKTKKFNEHTLKPLKIVIPATFLCSLILYSVLSGISLPDTYEMTNSRKIFKLLLFILTLAFNFMFILNLFLKSIIDVPTNEKKESK